jgi:hypothetical protein
MLVLAGGGSAVSDAAEFFRNSVREVALADPSMEGPK